MTREILTPVLICQKKKGEFHNSLLCFHPYHIHRVEMDLICGCSKVRMSEGEVSARNLGGNGDL